MEQNARLSPGAASPALTKLSPSAAPPENTDNIPGHIHIYTPANNYNPHPQATHQELFEIFIICDNSVVYNNKLYKNK